MIPPTVTQNIDLWEAWIDVQATEDNFSASIIVIGEVTVNNLILEPKFVKLSPPSEKENRLVLEIVPNVLSDEGTELEIMYAEELNCLEQYSGVTIYVAGEIIVEMDNLEVIY